MNEWFETLDGVLRTAWSELEKGVANRNHAARNVTLATVSEGVKPTARTVVLRRADKDRSELEIHTDLRSGKITDLHANPMAGVHVWLPELQLQLRLSCQVTIATGDTVAALWDKVPASSRQAYGITPAPGTPIEASLAYEKKPDPTIFAVLTCRVEDIDVVHLGDDHRRARFTKKRDWVGEWLAP